MKNMQNLNREVFFGQLREVLTAVGSLIAAYGYLNESAWLGVSGFIMAAAAVIWGLSYRSADQVVLSALRKVISSLPGLLLALGLMNEQQSASLVALLIPLVSMLWSFKANKVDKDFEMPYYNEEPPEGGDI